MTILLDFILFLMKLSYAKLLFLLKSDPPKLNALMEKHSHPSIIPLISEATLYLREKKNYKDAIALNEKP